jgi:type I restriction enzyme M protein
MAANTDIKELLKAMGFVLEDGKKNVWKKTYSNHSNYKLSIDIETESISYGPSITIGDKTTSNFKADENFVVLDCVNKLLEKGYSPENITLEKDFPLGHKTKGKLDILVTDDNGKAYLMIECKTYGVEFEKANKKTIADGGQLFSYYQQDKSAKYLCLYASKLEGKTVKYQNSIIKVEEYFDLANNAKEAFEKWNKNIKDNGIFESWAKPYNVSIKSLTKESLKPLTKEDSSRIFNQFAEILRHNVVSDKPNAFNKLITLLLCKIVDEEKGANEELHFQWLENDTNIDLQKRLNDLYKTGMSKYLTKTVTDYSDQDVDNIVGLDDSQRNTIKNMMTELRLKKNNEFAFKEVFNDASFEENSIVLREVVDLFQPYQVRYNKKQQFLGDFFELLLNTSIKQEAGQYFTPVPIARFIINSIPFREIINMKIEKGDINFLPYVIDFACGSGHFITEAMDEINNIIIELNEQNNFRPEIKRKLKIWAGDASFDWAYEYVYGIEKDYRLVKTAKVSCFLNGDGLARIFNADGLANFKKDTDYRGKLKVTSKNDKIDNQEFEVLVANPPYSVSAFKNTLINGNISFDLYNRLTDTSSEIECLFIERTKQLMNDGGFVGIILPSSILSNSGIYEDAREIILKYFEIVSIVEFSSNTFMATGTNTVTLFLKKRNNTDWQQIQHIVNTFFINLKDVSCNGTEKPFSTYVTHIFKTISLDDYITLANRKPNENIQKHEFYLQYVKWFNELTLVKNLKEQKAFKIKSDDIQQAELDKLFFDLVLEKENEKILYFILALPQKVVLIKSNPDNKNESEKAFLGYEFSNRRGHEGIKAYSGRSIQEATKLYDENDLLNPKKANTYIYKAFLNEFPEIDETLQNNVFIHDLVNLMSFDRVDFIKNISLAVKKKVIETNYKYPKIKLDQIIELISGQSPESEYYNEKGDGLPFYQGKTEFGYNFLNNPVVWTTQITKEARKGDIVMTVRAPVGPVNIVPFDKICIGRGLSALRSQSKDLNQMFLYQFLKYNQDLITGKDGVAFQSISRNEILNISIPIPSFDIQQKIVEEIEKIDQKERNAIQRKGVLQEQMFEIYSKEKQKHTLQKLPEYIEIISGGTPDTNEPLFWNGSIPWLSVVDFSNENRFVDKSEKTITEAGLKNSSTKFLNAGDIIISARGTVGAIAQLKIPMTFNQSCYGIRGKEKLNNNFLYYALKYEIQQFKNNASGVIFNAITIKTFDSIYIPVPTISEQKIFLQQIEKLEKEIAEIKQFIHSVDEQKKNILRKYLE